MIYLKEGKTPLNFAYGDEIIQEENSKYQLSFKFPTNNSMWEQLTEETFLLADDLHGEQEFIIFEIERHHSYITVYANQVATLLNNYSISEISVDRADGNRVMRALVSSIIREHPFTFYSNIATMHSLNLKNVSVATALFKDKHSIIGQWGGDLVRDKYDIRLLHNGGSNNESLFMYKKNLKSYKQKKSLKDLRTRIHFTKTINGKGENEPDTVLSVTVDSPLINKYNNIYEGNLEVNDQDVVDEKTLLAYAQQYYKTTLCDVIEDSIEIDVIGKPDAPVKIFDTVTIFHEKFNFDMKKKITKYTYSPMGKRLKTIGFGKVQSSLGSALSSMVDDKVEEIVEARLDPFKIQKNLAGFLKKDRESLETKIRDLEEVSKGNLEVKKALFEADTAVPEIVKTKILDAVEADIGRLKTIITEAELIQAIQAHLDFASIKSAIIDKAFIKEIISDETFRQEFEQGEVTTQNIFTKLKDSIQSNIRKDFITKDETKKLVNDLTINADGIRQITQEEALRVFKDKKVELKGQDGKSSYIHTKYSNSSNGNPMTDSANSDYIGIYTGTSSTPPTDYRQYQWTRVKGDSNYIHRKYSNNANGTPMSDDSNLTYIGIYTGTSVTPPTNASEYSWTKVKGEDGKDGVSVNRNFLPNSNFERGLEKWEAVNLNSSRGLNYNFDHAIINNYGGGIHLYSSNVTHEYAGLSSDPFPFIAKNGDKVTVSFDLAGDKTDVGNLRVALHYVKNHKLINQEWQGFDIKQAELYPRDSRKYKRIERTFTVNGDVDKLRLMIFPKKDDSINVYINNIKVEQGSQATSWSPAYEDLQGHSLTANVRFEGTYINNVTNNIKTYVDVYYDGQKVDSGYEVKIKHKGAGQTNWTDFASKSVNNGLVNFAIPNGEKDGTPLDVIALVTYKGLSTTANERMDNMPDVVEIKEVVKKYKTFDSTLEQFNSTIGEVKNQLVNGGRNLILNSGKLESFRKGGTGWSFSIQNGVLIAQKTGDTDNNGFHVGFNDFLKDSLQNEQLTWSIDLKADRNISLSSIGAETGGQRGGVNLTTSWQRFTHTFTNKFTRYYNFSFYNWSANSFPKGVKIYVKFPKIEQGTLATTYSPAPEDVNLVEERVESKILQTKNEINLAVEGNIKKATEPTDNLYSSTREGNSTDLYFQTKEDLNANNYYTVVFKATGANDNATGRVYDGVNVSEEKSFKISIINGLNAFLVRYPKGRSTVGGVNIDNLPIGVKLSDIKIYKGNYITYFKENLTKAEIKVLKDQIDLKVDKNGVIAAINLSGEGTKITGGAIVDELWGKTIRGSTIVGGKITGETKITLGTYGFMQPTQHGGLQINSPHNFHSKDGVGVQIIGGTGRDSNVPYGMFIYKDNDFTQGDNAVDTDSYLLTVQGYIRTKGVNNLKFQNYTDGSTSIGIWSKNVSLLFDAKDNDIFYAYAGTKYSLWSVVTANSSDFNLKKNIVKSTDKALAVINKLDFKSYDWKDNNKSHTNIGLIAQEVQNIDETLVYKNGDYLSLDTLKLTNIALKAIQELSEKNEVLERENKELKQNYEKVIDRLNKLEEK